MMFTLEPGRYARTFFALLVLGVMGLLQGCVLDDDDPDPIPTADPTGYYSQGTLSVDGVPDDNDLQAMIYNNRIMMLSISNGLLYDGTMQITGNDFTATVTVYTKGIDAFTATMKGTITAGSQITGGTLTGTGVGNGTFSLTYADSNNQLANVERIDNSSTNAWMYPIYGESDFGFKITLPTALVHYESTRGGSFNSCEITVNLGSIAPASGTAMYDIALELSSCDSNGTITPEANSDESGGAYTGLVVSKTAVDNVLTVAFSNGSYAIIGEFELFDYSKI